MVYNGVPFSYAKNQQGVLLPFWMGLAAWQLALYMTLVAAPSAMQHGKCSRYSEPFRYRENVYDEKLNCII